MADGLAKNIVHKLITVVDAQVLSVHSSKLKLVAVGALTVPPAKLAVTATDMD